MSRTRKILAAAGFVAVIGGLAAFAVHKTREASRLQGELDQMKIAVENEATNTAIEALMLSHLRVPVVASCPEEGQLQIMNLTDGFNSVTVPYCLDSCEGFSIPVDMVLVLKAQRMSAIAGEPYMFRIQLSGEEGSACEIPIQPSARPPHALPPSAGGDPI
jgi:hypothetical protein